MNRRTESKLSLLLPAALLAMLSACADLTAATDAPSALSPSGYVIHDRATNPLGNTSTVNPLEPSPG